MRKIVLKLVFLILACFCFLDFVNAQSVNEDKDKIKIIQKSSNKKRLISGEKIDVRQNNLQHLRPNKITILPRKSNHSIVKNKKEQPIKGPKILKYGSRKDVNIKREENE